MYIRLNNTRRHATEKMLKMHSWCRSPTWFHRMHATVRGSDPIQSRRNLIEMRFVRAMMTVDAMPGISTATNVFGRSRYCQSCQAALSQSGNSVIYLRLQHNCTGCGAFIAYRARAHRDFGCRAMARGWGFTVDAGAAAPSEARTNVVAGKSRDEQRYRNVNAVRLNISQQYFFEVAEGPKPQAVNRSARGANSRR